MYSEKMTVTVKTDGNLTLVSRSYRGDTAEKRVKAAARKFSREAYRRTVVYKVRRGTEERPWFYFYYAMPSAGFTYNGEPVAAFAGGGEEVSL